MRYMGILIVENSFVILEIFDVALASLLPAVIPCRTGHRVAATEDRYVGKSGKSQHHECVYESATARSFRSVQLTMCTTYCHCVNANKVHVGCPTP